MEKACPWLMDLKISLFSTGCQGCRKAMANENKNSNPKHPSWGIATLCIYPAFFIGLATFGRQTDKESRIYTQDGDSPIQKGKQNLVLSKIFAFLPQIPQVPCICLLENWRFLRHQACWRRPLTTHVSTMACRDGTCEAPSWELGFHLESIVFKTKAGPTSK